LQPVYLSFHLKLVNCLFYFGPSLPKNLKLIIMHYFNMLFLPQPEGCGCPTMHHSNTSIFKFPKHFHHPATLPKIINHRRCF